jgi:hypothetical protein
LVTKQKVEENEMEMLERAEQEILEWEREQDKKKVSWG